MRRKSAHCFAKYVQLAFDGSNFISSIITEALEAVKAIANVIFLVRRVASQFFLVSPE